jgi:hypothetical protein
LDAAYAALGEERIMTEKSTDTRGSEGATTPTVRGPIDIKGHGNVIGDNSSSHVITQEVNTDGSGSDVSVSADLGMPPQSGPSAAEAPNSLEEVHDLLERLTRLVADVSSTIEANEAALIAQDVETLSKEVAREKPRRPMYEVTVEGLKQAAINIGEVGVPILETAVKLLTVLRTVFP